MGKKHKWFVAGTCVIGVAIGITFCGTFSNVIHWAGSTQFCGEFCHSMDVTYMAYKKGLHHNTRTGMQAGCSDCHLLNGANKHNNPLEYTALLFDKAKAGTHSLIGEIKGNLGTPEKQVAERERMAKDVEALMIERRFSNCRACHDVTAMNNPKNRIASNFHKHMTADAKVQVNCLECHPTAGHNYDAVKNDVDKLIQAAK